MAKRMYFETEQVITTRTKGYIEYETNFTQLYHSFQKVATKFRSVSEVCILLHYCRVASNKGIITTNEQDYDKFIDEHRRMGGDSISRINFSKAIKNMTDNKVLIKLSRGVYQLNPLLIWNDSVESRKEIIEDISKTEEPIKTQYLLNK
jgi:hypothetical protein